MRLFDRIGLSQFCDSMRARIQHHHFPLFVVALFNICFHSTPLYLCNAYFLTCRYQSTKDSIRNRMPIWLAARLAVKQDTNDTTASSSKYVVDVPVPPSGGFVQVIHSGDRVQLSEECRDLDR